MYDDDQYINHGFIRQGRLLCWGLIFSIENGYPRLRHWNFVLAIGPIPSTTVIWRVQGERGTSSEVFCHGCLWFSKIGIRGHRAMGHRTSRVRILSGLYGFLITRVLVGGWLLLIYQLKEEVVVRSRLRTKWTKESPMVSLTQEYGSHQQLYRQQLKGEETEWQSKKVVRRSLIKGLFTERKFSNRVKTLGSKNSLNLIL